MRIDTPHTPLGSSSWGQTDTPHTEPFSVPLEPWVTCHVHQALVQENRTQSLIRLCWGPLNTESMFSHEGRKATPIPKETGRHVSQRPFKRRPDSCTNTHSPLWCLCVYLCTCESLSEKVRGTCVTIATTEGGTASWFCGVLSRYPFSFVSVSLIVLLKLSE